MNFRKLKTYNHIEIKIGMVVWCYLEGLPWWPVVVVNRDDHEPALDTGESLIPATETNRMVELFCADNRFAVVELSCLREYTSNMHLCRQKCKLSPDMLKACEEANAHIENCGLKEQKFMYENLEPFDELTKGKMSEKTIEATGLKCLSCTRTIRDSSAIYTKPCKHIFCVSCATMTMEVEEELLCPKCDTVLPKDGTAEINLRPDNQTIEKVSEAGFGLNPKQLCQILQNGLEFWAHQQNNESLMEIQSLSQVQRELEEEKARSREIMMALQAERRKMKEVVLEKEGIMGQFAALVMKHEEQAGSLQKLTEAHNELRAVHEKLDSDLRRALVSSALPLDNTMRTVDTKSQNKDQAEMRLNGNNNGCEMSIQANQYEDIANQKGTGALFDRKRSRRSSGISKRRRGERKAKHEGRRLCG